MDATKVPELGRKLLITLGLLVVYRLGVHVPTPGVDATALTAFFQSQGGALLGILDIFTGGGLSRLSIFALGVWPYISASIAADLLTHVIPQLEALKKEGEQGRRKINQYVRYGTIAVCVVQGGIMLSWLESGSAPGGQPIVLNPGWSFRILTLMTMTAGTIFLMWLGEQITHRGIGNGVSMIIFAGIVGRIPSAAANTFRLIQTGEMDILVFLLVLVLIFGSIGFIVFMEMGQRRLPVQYPTRMVGRRVFQGQDTHLPLKINTAGVIPPIFAQAVLTFLAYPAQASENITVQSVFGLFVPGHALYIPIYIFMIVFFCFFYTGVIFNPVDVADNLRKYGGYIPGLRPGRKTAEYINSVLSRITLGGAIYLSLISLLPIFMSQQFNVPFYFGGTALLIVVGVALDFIQQVQAQLLVRQYKGFLEGRRLKGRRG